MKDISILELENEKRQQMKLQRIRGFRLMDDDFMSVCLKDSPEAANRILGIILGKPDIKVTKVETQVEMRNLYGRSIRLDMKAQDKDGVYNCEIQRADKGATPRRARYHGSLLDANQTVTGALYEDIPETYIIFITEKDYFGKGDPIYRFERICEETGIHLNDGLHIIYVNGEYRGNDDIGWLMHDFSCTKSDEIHYTELAERVRYFKEDEEGVRNMCRSIEEMLKEYCEEVAEKTTKQNKLEFAKRMITLGKNSLEEISECTNLDIETVRQLASEVRK